MEINSDVNILGSLPDFNLVSVFYKAFILNEEGYEQSSSYTKIKTDKSVKRFEKAIRETFLRFKNSRLRILIGESLETDGISDQTRLILFWNASFNNELFAYLNTVVFFPAFYSGRLIIKQDEVSACLKELRLTKKKLQEWSESTLELTASKYLTLLKKFTLLEGKAKKSIRYPYLSDKQFMLFVYIMAAVETKPNLLESCWLLYSFHETKVFTERILQKKFTKYISVTFSGNNLTVTPLIDYKEIYHASF